MIWERFHFLAAGFYPPSQFGGAFTLGVVERGWGGVAPLYGSLRNFCFAGWGTQLEVRTTSEERRWDRRKEKKMKLPERQF